MPILLTVFFLLAATSEPANQFARHSNGLDEYKLVTKKTCESGVHASGYALAPFGSVVLKQVNQDRTVGDVCVD